MKASELRIGNIVFVGKDYEAIIDSIESTTVHCQGNGVRNRYDQIKPIQLTEEWLKKLGFEYQGGSGYKAPTNTECWYFSLRNGFIPTMFHERTIKSDGYKGVFHVHQLQNLYFALTGEELTLNNLTPNQQ